MGRSNSVTPSQSSGLDSRSRRVDVSCIQAALIQHTATCPVFLQSPFFAVSRAQNSLSRHALFLTFCTR